MHESTSTILPQAGMLERGNVGYCGIIFNEFHVIVVCIVLYSVCSLLAKLYIGRLDILREAAAIYSKSRSWSVHSTSFEHLCWVFVVPTMQSYSVMVPCTVHE